MKEVCEVGVLVGYLLIDVKVILVDGFYYDVDFLEMVFKIVGFMVIKEGVIKVLFVLLEFMMKVEVEVFEDFIGNIIGDLNFWRG